MYSFKLKIHVFGWLLLALLLVILLCLFLPSVSAAENDVMVYNGVEFPNIDSVWTQKDKYPFGVIYYDASSCLYRFLTLNRSVPYYTERQPNGYVGLYSGMLWQSFALNSGSWNLVYAPTSSSGMTFLDLDVGDYLVWSSFDILFSSDDSKIYFSASDPVPVDPGPSSAELPVFTVDLPVITWVEYNVGDTPTPVTVEAVVDDGGTISYTWYRNIYAESGSPSNVVFSTGSTLVPDTSVVSDSSYYCVATNTNGAFSQSAYSQAYRVKVVESGASDPPSETPTYPSAENIGSSVGDAFQGVLDQNDINTSEQGNSFVDQITQIVPNESQGFVNAMGGLVDSLSYGGTECVLTVPALVMPQIGDLVPQYTLLEKQTVDLESYFNMFPDFIVTLVQSLFTVALIVFCFKELYSTVSYFFVLRGGET